MPVHSQRGSLSRLIIFLLLCESSYRRKDHSCLAPKAENSFLTEGCTYWKNAAGQMEVGFTIHTKYMYK